MESKALFDFSGQSGDELSFRRGVTLKITNKEDDSWYKAELNGTEGLVPGNYVDFKPPFWYMTIPKEEAVKILSAKQGASFQHKDGAFIVRPSEANPGEISLSVKAGDVQHFKILRTPRRDKYFLWANEPEFTSVNQLVQHYRTASVSRTSHVPLRDLLLSKVMADYKFESRGPDELELQRGDIIIVIDKNDPDWWNGFVERDGKISRGLFPSSYVHSYNE